MLTGRQVSHVARPSDWKDVDILYNGPVDRAEHGGGLQQQASVEQRQPGQLLPSQQQQGSAAAWTLRSPVQLLQDKLHQQPSAQQTSPMRPLLTSSTTAGRHGHSDAATAGVAPRHAFSSPQHDSAFLPRATVGLHDLRDEIAQHPLTAPFADHMTSPPNYLRPSPAMRDLTGNWSYMHKMGVGTMAVAPPSPSPNSKLLAVQQRSQIVGSTAQTYRGVPVYGSLPTAATASASTSLAAVPSSGAAQQRPSAKSVQRMPYREVKSLSTNTSIVNLVTYVLCGDPLSNILSFEAEVAAEKHWPRDKGSGKRVSEYNQFVAKVKQRAAEQRCSWQEVAAAMDAGRSQRGCQVAKFVKEIMYPHRVQHKGMMCADS